MGQASTGPRPRGRGMTAGNGLSLKAQMKRKPMTDRQFNRAIGIIAIVTTFAVVVIVAWGMTVVLSRP